jgi:hypothetical protein
MGKVPCKFRQFVTIKPSIDEIAEAKYSHLSRSMLHVRQEASLHILHFNCSIFTIKSGKAYESIAYNFQLLKKHLLGRALVHITARSNIVQNFRGKEQNLK